MHKIAYIAVFLVFALFPTAARAQSNPYKYVYRVVCSGNPNVRGNVILTGFRMQGWKGIVTSLHGVAGATDIRAGNATSNLDNLKIYWVDVKNDLALLGSPAIAGDEGFQTSSSSTFRPGETLKVYGHPRGIETREQPASIGNPVWKLLSSLIPPDSSIKFGDRRSPSGDIQVLDMDANLVPGDSGAPVLDSNGNIVGIVGGGIIGAAISWAIPVQNIKWRDAREENAELVRLGRLSPGDLFTLETGQSAGTDPGNKDVYTFQVSGTFGQYPINTPEFNETHRILVSRLGKYRNYNLTIKEMKNGRLCTIVVLKSPELHNISGETNDRFGSLRENFLAGIGFIILTKRVADAELWLNPGWRCTH